MSLHQGAVPELAMSAVGIGRPIAESSLDTFMEVFDAIMPPEVDFIPREIPGVNYIDAERLAALIGTTSVKLSKTGVASFATSIVDSLCVQGRIDDETTREARRIRIKEVRHRDSNPASGQLQMRLIDQIDDFYPQGYLLLGEKTIFEQVLGIASWREPRKSGKAPGALLKLGTVVGDPRLVTTPKMTRIKKVFQEHVELAPVGHVTSS